MFAIVVFFSVAIGALIKGIAGAGLPIVAVPVMASVLGVEHAVAVMTIPSFVANIGMIWALRRRASATGELALFIVLGVAGTFLGAWILAAVAQELMSLVLAVWVCVYLASRFVGRGLAISDRAAPSLAPPFGFLTGIFQSATGLSFPVFGPYLQARGFNRDRFAFSSSAILVVLSFVQFVSYARFDLLSPTRIAESLLAVIPMAIALPLGNKVAHRFDKRRFDRLVTVILLATVATLVYRGVAAL